MVTGCTEAYEDLFMGYVHVKDVAMVRILVYENSSASGRHTCYEAIAHFGDLPNKVAELYPDYKYLSMNSNHEDTEPGLMRVKDPSKKLIYLGMRFIPLEEIIEDSVENLKSKGCI
ncbi:uncharacterized protein A4U43_C08F33970 [Asparagus officinalis]|nr:uncharacterized protein A4U43_C08F33970 [Asparagus officinalis]